MIERPEADRSAWYEEWLLAKQTMETPDLSPRVLEAVRADEQNNWRWMMVLVCWQRHRDKVVKSLACLGALTIGSTPFVYLAYVAQLIAY